MDLDSLPSQAEVMGWIPRTLADFMRRLKLSGCDKVVMRGSITGAQFMRMTERDLQGFPSIYVPMITKIQSDINSCEQKKAFGQRLKASIFPKQTFAQEEDAWDSDEFDNESDKDYKNADRDEGEDSEIDDDDYEMPSFESTRSKTPVPSKTDHSKLKGSNIKSTVLSTCKLSFRRGPKPTDPPHIRSTKVSQAPAVPAAPHTFANSTPEPEKGLDPSWYGGTLTRRQAEVALRQMNEDGAFVVRDSSKGSTEHPYTMMVLKDGRVYNIKIQNIGNSYSLGTNPQRGQSFPGVREMIIHHTHTPLLLIGATDRNSGAQSQCCLLHPVGI